MRMTQASACVTSDRRLSSGQFPYQHALEDNLSELSPEIPGDRGCRPTRGGNQGWLGSCARLRLTLRYAHIALHATISRRADYRRLMRASIQAGPGEPGVRGSGSKRSTSKKTSAAARDAVASTSPLVGSAVR